MWAFELVAVWLYAAYFGGKVEFEYSNLGNELGGWATWLGGKALRPRFHGNDGFT